MNKNEELVMDPEMEEITDPMDQETVEDIADSEEEPTEKPKAPKMFTQEEVDEIASKARARGRAKGERDTEKRYASLMATLRTGTGKETPEEIDTAFRDHYQKKGLVINKPSYSKRDSDILGKAEAQEIIDDGFGAVVEETDRLAKLGVANMTEQDKARYMVLAEYRQSTERSRELQRIGVTEEEIRSPEFLEFSKMFDKQTPMAKVYEIYRKTKPKKEIKTMGSMKQGQGDPVKDFYTEEEIMKLSEDDLNDPKVWEAVRRSMTGG